MAFIRRNVIADSNSENYGIHLTPNLKDNLESGRKHNRPKQAFGEIKNIIHNQNKNGDSRGAVPKKIGSICKPEPKCCTEEPINEDFEEFFDTCSYKRDDRSLEQIWMEEAFLNSGQLNKIKEAGGPRLKRITKEELEWIQQYQYGNYKENSYTETENFIENLDAEFFKTNLDISAPNYPSDLDISLTDDSLDLNFSNEVEDITQNKFKYKSIVDKPIIPCEFDDLDFLNDTADLNLSQKFQSTIEFDLPPLSELADIDSL